MKQKQIFGDVEDSALLYKIAFTFAMKESDKVLAVALEKKESEKTFAVTVERNKNENFNMKSYYKERLSAVVQRYTSLLVEYFRFSPTY